ncbi:MAG: alpha/beta fold hydrolase [Acidimicrobiales bacterium]
MTEDRPTALPQRTDVDIADRGSAAMWDTGKVGDRPAVLLLHGWNVDAPLTFGRAVPHLTASDEGTAGYRVVMFDLHGHGSGVRADSRFDLERCADDALAVLDHLGIDAVVATGYSMGGSIAQLLARRAPHRVHGLVLAASAAHFAVTPRERAELVGLRVGADAMRRAPAAVRKRAFIRIAGAACRRYPDRVLETVLTADPVRLLEAGAQIRQFRSTSWLHEIRTPATVVVTERDQIVPPARQRALAAGLADVVRHDVDADHDLPIDARGRLGPILRRAVDSVHDRIASPSRG